MVPVGIMLGHDEMSLGGALILAVVGRIGFATLRARRADKDVSR